jgi:hypothetical protein
MKYFSCHKPKSNYSTYWFYLELFDNNFLTFNFVMDNKANKLNK